MKKKKIGLQEELKIFYCRAGKICSSYSYQNYINLQYSIAIDFSLTPQLDLLISMATIFLFILLLLLFLLICNVSATSFSPAPLIT